MRIRIPLDLTQENAAPPAEKAQPKTMPSEDKKEIPSETAENKEEEKEEAEVSKSGIPPVDTTHPEIEMEDKILTAKPISEDLFVYVVHQYGERILRENLCEFVKTLIAKDKSEIDIEALKKRTAEIAKKVEDAVIEEVIARRDIPVVDFNLN